MEEIKNPLLKKHHTRLVAEGIVKSVLGGAMAGFFAMFLAALAAWFFDFGGIWLAIGVGAAVGIGCGVLLYFLKYRPSVHEVLRRVDRFGLEERMITMLELEGDDSYIATLQRENAKESLREVEHRKLKLRFPVSVIVLASIALVLGVGMTVVTGLAGSEIIPSGEELINPEDPLINHIAITYEAGEGGVIEGEPMQLLLAGESTTPVVAVADDGWMFIGWDDGNEDPERSESDVQNEMIYTALFAEVGDEGEGGDSGEGQDGQQGEQEGDQAEDIPDGGSADNESGESGEGQEGSGSNSDGGESEGTGEGQEEGEGKGDGQGLGAGGKWQNSNQFIDGNTYYRDYLDMYYELAQELFAANGEIPPEMREFFEMYFGGI